jgi:integrase
MANTTVSLRERVKGADGHWRWSQKILIPDSKLTPAEAERKGRFYLVWTEKGRKLEQGVKGRTFESAIKAARVKVRHLEDAADGVQRPDPLIKRNRATVSAAIDIRLHEIEISKSADTLKAHRQALRQFEKWTTTRYVDQIDHDHLLQFRNWLVQFGNEHRHKSTRGNERLTADWKAMRVNQFVKRSLGLPDGKGPIKKSDLGKMKPNGPVKIYSTAQMESLFRVCKPHEKLRYRALFEPAFRKEELMYLEEEDVLVSRQMLRVKSKTRYAPDGHLLYTFKAKAGSEREVPISRELMQMIIAHMRVSRFPESRIVFCTRTGGPDTKMWDKLQSIAKRGGMNGFDLKTFRATRATEWLRPKWLGGFGYDVPTVKNLLGHDKDSESIWSYLKAVEKEVLVADINSRERKHPATREAVVMAESTIQTTSITRGVVSLSR